MPNKVPDGFNNDFERIQDVLAQYEVDNDHLAMAILQLFVKIAGEKLRSHEGVKAEIYKAILEKGWIKPEHQVEVYKYLQQSKEINNAK